MTASETDRNYRSVSLLRPFTRLRHIAFLQTRLSTEEDLQLSCASRLIAPFKVGDISQQGR